MTPARPPPPPTPTATATAVPAPAVPVVPVVRRTACPLDCPDGCSLEVTVVDGVLAKVDAVPTGVGNPLTQGFICAKVRRHADRVHGPHRLRTPLIRTGPKGSGQFREATWDEALDLAAGAIRTAIAEHGPASVVPYLYNSSAGTLGAGLLGPLLWEALGASSVAHTICAATAGEAWALVLGDRPGTDLTTIVDADLVVIWGANPSVSNTHLPPLVRRARANGAALVVVDPRTTPLAAQANLHLAVRPGTDVVLAMALAARLDATATNATQADPVPRAMKLAGSGRDDIAGLEEYLAACAGWTVERVAQICGVDPVTTERAASLLATAERPFFRLGWGMERNRNGGAAHRSVLSLAVLAGALAADGLGGGVHVDGGADAGIDTDALAGAVLGEPGTAGDLRRAPTGPVRNMNHLGRWLNKTSPEAAQVLFVQGANPAVTAPAQALVLEGLARDDLFTIVHDQVLTDTARYADVVLPATTHFETADLLAPYGADWVEAIEPVIPRIGQSRTNDEVTAALAARLGLPADRFDPDPRTVRARAALQGDGAPPLAVPTSWPVHLVADRVGVDRIPTYRERPTDPSTPLVLLSPASAKTINSMFGERDRGQAEVRVHPTDAAARHLHDGDEAIVHNVQATIAAIVRIDERTRPGVVVMVKGRWRPDAGSAPGGRGLGVNALVPDALSDLAGGATFNDALVQLTPRPDPT